MAKTFSLQGVVHKINEPKQFGGDYKINIQTFVLYVRSQAKDGRFFDDYITFKCVGQSLYQVEGVREGNKVEVLFVIQGKEGRKAEYKGQYFNDLRALKINLLEDTSVEQQQEKTQRVQAESEIDSFVDGDKDAFDPDAHPDDLPF